MNHHRRFTYTGIVIFVLATVLVCLYVSRDLETQSLTDKDRMLAGMRSIALPQGQVAYEMSNPSNKETVVFVHGFSVPSYVWDKNFAYFSDKGYRTLRFDLFGRGFSDRPEHQYGLDLYVEQLLGLLDALKVGTPIHLVGLSMGGPVVTRFTHAYPERVASLSLLAPLVETPHDPALTLLNIPLLGEYLATTLMMPRIVNALDKSVYDPSSFSDWSIRMQEHVHFKGYRRALLNTLRYLAGRDFLDDYQALGESGIPVQLAWGKNDQVVPFNQHQRVQKLLPDAALLALSECGHLPQREHPAIINQWLHTFIATHAYFPENQL